jgi:hypothetical protein
MKLMEKITPRFHIEHALLIVTLWARMFVEKHIFIRILLFKRIAFAKRCFLQIISEEISHILPNLRPNQMAYWIFCVNQDGEISRFIIMSTFNNVDLTKFKVQCAKSARLVAEQAEASHVRKQ